MPFKLIIDLKEWPRFDGAIRSTDTGLRPMQSTEFIPCRRRNCWNRHPFGWGSPWTLRFPFSVHGSRAFSNALEDVLCKIYWFLQFVSSFTTFAFNSKVEVERFRNAHDFKFRPFTSVNSWCPNSTRVSLDCKVTLAYSIQRIESTEWNPVTKTKLNEQFKHRTRSHQKCTLNGNLSLNKESLRRSPTTKRPRSL